MSLVIRTFTVAVVACLAGCKAGDEYSQASKQTPESRQQEVENFNQMLTDSPAYAAVKDNFIALARAGNEAGMLAMISAAQRRLTPDAEINRVNREEIIPFFKSHPTIKSMTIAPTYDQVGNEGYAYYEFAYTVTGKRDPFSVFVVKENGKLVIGSADVNRYIKGRHGD